jgi:hypothetical protein
MYILFIIVSWFLIHCWIAGEFSNDDLAGY